MVFIGDLLTVGTRYREHFCLRLLCSGHFKLPLSNRDDIKELGNVSGTLSVAVVVVVVKGPIALGPKQSRSHRHSLASWLQ
jgi:hypothetical protein